jgi:hypothetical protein
MWDEDASNRVDWAVEPWLWIDQTCIDQSNMEERNLQVAQMGYIYAEGFEVFVWLGNGRDGTEKATEELAADVKLFDTPGRSVVHLHALQIIAANKYWTCLWIIQALVLAKAVVIMSGIARICSGTLLHVLWWLDIKFFSEFQHIWDLLTRRMTIIYAHASGQGLRLRDDSNDSD